LLIALGTIRSQDQLGGKFRADAPVSRRNVCHFGFSRLRAIITQASFQRDPSPNEISAAEP
jgi:hypothetical protein